MTAAKTGSERNNMPWQKRVADICTAARGPLAVALIWLGAFRGKDGIQLALLMLLAAATLDTLDGYFARLSPYARQTWVGSHDLVFDIAFSAALLLYLALAGYLSPYLAALYAIFWIVIVWNQVALLSTLAVVFQAPLYAGVALAGVLHNADLLLWMIVWVAVMLVFAGRRFFHVRLPAFLADLFESIFRVRREPERHTRDRSRAQE